MGDFPQVEQIHLFYILQIPSGGEWRRGGRSFKECIVADLSVLSTTSQFEAGGLLCCVLLLWFAGREEEEEMVEKVDQVDEVEE